MAMKPTRRTILSGGAAAAGACLFDIVPSSVFAQPAPSDRINLGHIGIGGRGRGFLRPEAAPLTKPNPNLGGSVPDRMQLPARSVALCDVDSARLDDAATRVGGRPKTYKDFRRLLEDKDVDAVFIASPDHWHALMAVMACEAGKDVYVEKPACLTIEEGRAMVRAAERYGRVVQVGSQGRSQPAAYHACAYIRNGQIGTVRKVACWHYASPAGDWTPDSSAAVQSRLRLLDRPGALDSLQRETYPRPVPLAAGFRRRADPRPRRPHHEHRAVDHECRYQGSGGHRRPRRAAARRHVRHRRQDEHHLRIQESRLDAHLGAAGRDLRRTAGALRRRLSRRQGAAHGHLRRWPEHRHGAQSHAVRRSLRRRRGFQESRPRRESFRLHQDAGKAHHAHRSRRARGASVHPGQSFVCDGPPFRMGSGEGTHPE